MFVVFVVLLCGKPFAYISHTMSLESFAQLAGYSAVARTTHIRDESVAWTSFGVTLPKPRDDAHVPLKDVPAKVIAAGMHLDLSHHVVPKRELDESLNLGSFAEVPQYTPMYRTMHPDVTLAGAVAKFAQYDEPSSLALLGAVTRAAKTQVLTGGNNASQIARLGLVLRSNKHAAEFTGSVTPSLVTRVMSKLVSASNRSFDSFNDFRTDGGFINFEEEFTFNREADAGFPYPNHLKRKSTIGAELDAHNTLMVVADEDPSAYLKVLEATVVAKCKPKFEVVKAEKLVTGTRNIQVLPAYSSILPALLASELSANLNATTPKGCLSLYGFNPFGGGLNKVLGQMMATADEQRRSFAFYSDNFFVMRSTNRDFVFYSFDGQKMEGTAGHIDTHYVVGAALSQLFPSAPSGMLSTMLQAILRTSVNIPTKFRSTTFVVPGLASGSQWTSAINHLRMACLADLMSERITTADYRSGEEISPMSSDLPVLMELEDTSARRDSVYCGSFTKAPVWFPGTVQKCAIRLDMLGFDCVKYETSDGEEIFLPCLAYDRIIKMITFPTFSRLNADLGIVMRRIIVSVAYIVGGYAYPDLASFLPFYYEDLGEQSRSGSSSASDEDIEAIALQVRLDVETIRSIMVANNGSLPDALGPDLVMKLNNVV